jgi:hypothetical protein
VSFFLVFLHFFYTNRHFIVFIGISLWITRQYVTGRKEEAGDDEKGPNDVSGPTTATSLAPTGLETKQGSSRAQQGNSRAGA